MNRIGLTISFFGGALIAHGIKKKDGFIFLVGVALIGVAIGMVI